MFKVRTKNVSGSYVTYISLENEDAVNPKDEPNLEECAMAFIPEEVIVNKPIKKGRKKNV